MALRLLLAGLHMTTASALRIQDTVAHGRVAKGSFNISTLEGSLLKALNNATECNMCQDRWLFIMGAGGRTGSSSLLDMMNAVQGFYITGENGMLVTDLLSYYNKLKSHSWAENKWSSWQHRAIDEKAVLCGMQALARESLGDLPPGTHTIGYKEIRWFSEELIDFMTKLFPCGRFIVNTRSIEKQLKSINRTWGTWGQEQELVIKPTQMLVNFQAKNPVRAKLLRTEDFDVQHFNDVLRWLGVTNCRFGDVCHSNSYHKWQGCDKKTVMVGNCMRDTSQNAAW
uniref:Protein-tyrosine sulfotransferase n=1 Tax=Alexandrium catenella TaxID=2925 RepID=A0A7S1S7K4_ALECA